ncbi:MAG TPA: glycosyl hydrolase [Microlunatus sp.]|nr:glycosyl hydrolase [Microlunatus sp.]
MSSPTFSPSVSSPSVSSPSGSSPSESGLSDLRRTFAQPPGETRPMMRWWWFGPDVTQPDIDRDLTAMARAGIGGAEVACVYPLSADPDSFLSKAHLSALRYAGERAEQLGLRLDITLGTGWSFGGPHVTPDLAARKLDWQYREIGPAGFEAPRRSWPEELVVGAYVGNGSLQERPETYEPVTLTGETVVVPRGRGPRVLLTGTARPTGQNVKRAAYGAEGLVFDHYSAEATVRHLDIVGRPMVEAVGAERLGSVFCDSLEVYAADWTTSMFEEFAARRGYRCEDRLWLLVTDHPSAPALRRDYFRTLTELAEENFLAVMAGWAHDQGVRLRVQSYGEPPVSLSSYRHVDLIEGEQCGWTRLPMTKWASSAARHLGVDVVSSETWTWIHAPSFRATPLDLKGEAHEHALLGINQFVGHGWPCRSGGMDGIGWFFYASGAFDDRNAWWPAMPGLARYLQRLSWVLRQGRPVRDVLLYLPTEDAYARFGPSIDLHTVSTELIPAQIPCELRQAGYDFDLVDDHFLAGYAGSPMGAGPAPVVLLPYAVTLTDAAQAHLAAIVAAGGRVITADVSGEGAAGDRWLAELAAARPADVTLTPATPDVGVVHRCTGDADLWFVVNTGPHIRNVSVALRDARRVLERWDLHSGAVATCDAGPEGVAVSLAPYEGVLLVGHDGPTLVDPAGAPSEPSVEPPALCRWRLQSESGADLGPVELPHRWEDDSRIGPAFSGTVSYVAEVGPSPGIGPLVLDFGDGVPDEADVVIGAMEVGVYRARISPPVREVVEVLVDGRTAGVVWDAPWRIELGEVSPGGTVTLRVGNTTANALSVDPTVQEWAAASERLHGRRFRMQALDRARDGISSGLSCVPVLRSRCT